jgi:hypothetical protein
MWLYNIIFVLFTIYYHLLEDFYFSSRETLSQSNFFPIYKKYFKGNICLHAAMN